MRLQVPEDRQIGRVHLLRAGVTLPVQHERGAITVRVPSILEHEVVAVDFVA